MSFGDLTDQEKLSLEQRTAAFFNLAGIRAQEVLGCVNAGLSTRKIYKILANAIQDWTWLSFSSPEEFKFHGIGGLIWVPHRFGALGLVQPHIQYTIRFNYGLFPNVIDLVGADEYAKYGCVAREEGEVRKIQFAPFLAYGVLQKLPVKPHEQHYWGKIVEVYSKLDDETLDAMASCRSRTTGAHSLWIQFVHWKREMGIALDRLRQEDPKNLEEEKKTELRTHIEAALACIRNTGVKAAFRLNLNEHVQKTKTAAANTELAKVVPCLNDLDKMSFLNFDTFVKLFNHLGAVNGICQECLKQTGLISGTEEADLDVIQQRLGDLGRLHLQNASLIDERRWFTLLRPVKEKNKELASLCLQLITEVYKVFEKELGLPIHRPTEHYSEFLRSRYPLPTEHFLTGF